MLKERWLRTAELHYLEKLTNVRYGKLSNENKVALINKNGENLIIIENDKGKKVKLKANDLGLDVVEVDSEEYFNEIKELIYLAERHVLDELDDSVKRVENLMEYVKQKLNNTKGETQLDKINTIIEGYLGGNLTIGAVLLQLTQNLCKKGTIMRRKKNWYEVISGNVKHQFGYEDDDFKDNGKTLKLKRSWGKEVVIDKLVRYFLNNIDNKAQYKTDTVKGEDLFLAVYTKARQIKDVDLKMLVSRLEENYKQVKVARFINKDDYLIEIVQKGKIKGIILTPYLEQTYKYNGRGYLGNVYYDKRFKEYMYGLYHEIEKLLNKN